MNHFQKNGVAYKASAPIRTNRAIYRSASVANTCTEADAATQTKVPLGITAGHGKFAQGSYADLATLLSSDTVIAQTGDGVDFFGEGEVAWAIAGGTITDLSVPLVATTDGKLIATVQDWTTAPTTYQWAVGFPLRAAAAGEIFPVEVKIFFTPI
jgi:hypothetical protein